MKIKLSKEDQQAIIGRVGAIDDQRLKGLVYNLRAMGGASHFSQWMVFNQFGQHAQFSRGADVPMEQEAL